MLLKRRWRWLAVFGLIVAILYLINASWLAPGGNAKPVLLSHRGVHHTYDRRNLEPLTCTARRIYPPRHRIFENTIPSFAAAFALHADIVEFDVHPTTDGDFVVWHDANLDCRTDGSGWVWEHDLAYLKRLDIGHGYTADGGKSYPLRGLGRGQMHTLEEVLRAFPDKRFLLNLKARDPAVGDALVRYMNERRPGDWKRISTYGQWASLQRVVARHPEVGTFSSATVKRCAKSYLLLGWSGHVPAACRNTTLLIPVNYTWAVWGWPNRFMQRMRSVGTKVYLTGPVANLRQGGIPGLDTPDALRSVPSDWSGGIWTNRIDVIGPLVAARYRREGKAN